MVGAQVYGPYILSIPNIDIRSKLNTSTCIDVSCLLSRCTRDARPCNSLAQANASDALYAVAYRSCGNAIF